MKEITSPYRVLFGIGIFYALGGLSLWVLFPFGIVDYPLRLHADWMMQGFLVSFAMGFLMTALPKFLNSKPCRSWEMAVAVFCAGLPALRAFSWITDLETTYLPFLWLVIYAAQRFRGRSFNPPPGFIFLPLGLLSGILGIFSKSLVTEGALLAFVFGIGSKLIPALLGHSKPILIQLGSSQQDRSLLLFCIEASIFFAGIVFHLGWAPHLGDFCWAVAGSSTSLRTWGIIHRPKIFGVLAYLLWASSWILISSLWALFLLPDFRIHFLHGVYIGGMTLMTLCVATRVVLAHGGYDLRLEQSSKLLLTVGILCIVAVITRISVAFLSPDLYFTHLAYASTALILAFVLWGYGIGRKMLHNFSAKESEEDCR